MNLAQYIMAHGRSLDVTNITGVEAETSASPVVGDERKNDSESVLRGGVGEQFPSNGGGIWKTDVGYVCYLTFTE